MTTTIMAYNSAPAYGSSSLAMPPPPPFEMSAQDLVSMDSYDGFDTPPQYMASPTNNKVALDLSKYKTRLCRHYLNGNSCPFEDRCAFAHGHDEQAAARAAAQAAMPPPPPPPPSYELHASGNSSDVDGQETRSNMNLGGSREEESRPSTPPAYPSRFRYDPYSPSGVVYAQ